MSDQDSFKGWLQSSDFTSKDYDVVTLEMIRKLFNEHDWSKEFEFAEIAESQGKEFCPAGIGIIYNDSEILHICPSKNGTNLVHFHFSQPSIIFGFIPWMKRKILSLQSASDSLRNEFIYLFFDRQFDMLEKTLNELA